jgi:hypothetical protein
LQSRPGTQHLQEVKDSSKAVRNIAFIVSETVSYNLEFGDQYIRFYKEDTVTGPGRIENPPGTPVEVASPYLEAELFDIQIQQSIDVMYLIHPNHAPRRLTRFSDTVWTLSTLVFNPAPTAELPTEPAANITLGALTGTGITLTATAGVFQNGDVQRIVKGGTGRATIVSFTSSTVVTVDIIDDFDSLSYTSGNWTLEGSPFGEVTPSDTGPVGGIITLTSTGEAEVVTNLIEDSGSCPSTDWTASGSGTNEYYLLNTAAGYTATEPDRVKELGVNLVKGSLGTLGIAQWGWGNNDALGYNTIYTRLTDETDPDSKCGDEDYVQRATVDPAADLFRASDVGKYVIINGGFTKITSFWAGQPLSRRRHGHLLAMTSRISPVVQTPETLLKSHSRDPKTIRSNGWSAAKTYLSERRARSGLSGLQVRFSHHRMFRPRFRPPMVATVFSP